MSDLSNKKKVPILTQSLDVAATLDADAKAKVRPVTVWAAIGGALLVLQVYVWIRWITGPYFERVPGGPSDPPLYMKIPLILNMVVVCVGLPIAVWWFLIRPWVRERRITLDGILLVSMGLMFFQDPLLSLGARGWLALASTVVSGLAAGLVPYVYLRRAARRSGVDAPRWPVVMLAGGGVGLLLLVTELITRVGGARILDAVSELSAADRAFRSGADASRLRFALLVLFIGALTATIAFGRALKRPERPSD